MKINQYNNNNRIRDRQSTTFDDLRLRTQPQATMSPADSNASDCHNGRSPSALFVSTFEPPVFELTNVVLAPGGGISNFKVKGERSIFFLFRAHSFT